MAALVIDMTGTRKMLARGDDEVNEVISKSAPLALTVSAFTHGGAQNGERICHLVTSLVRGSM